MDELKLQFFADGGEESTPAGESKPGNQPADKTADNHPGVQADALVDALMAAVTQRTARAETSVVRSMAEQYGMSEDEMRGILEKARAEKQKTVPPEVQKQIDDATKRAQDLLLAAEVRSAGLSMGLQDVETALLLMDRSKVSTGADGTVTGVAEALEALKSAKPFLFGKPAGAWAQKQSTAPAVTRETIAAIKDPLQRRKAIEENLNLFEK